VSVNFPVLTIELSAYYVAAPDSGKGQSQWFLGLRDILSSVVVHIFVHGLTCHLGIYMCLRLEGVLLSYVVPSCMWSRIHVILC